MRQEWMGATFLIFKGKTAAARDAETWRMENAKAEATGRSSHQTTLGLGQTGLGAPEPKAAGAGLRPREVSEQAWLPLLPLLPTAHPDPPRSQVQAKELQC